MKAPEATCFRLFHLQLQEYTVAKAKGGYMPEEEKPKVEGEVSDAPENNSGIQPETATDNPTTPQEPQTIQPKKKSRKKLFIILGVVLLLLAVIGGASATYIFTREEMDTTATVQPSEQTIDDTTPTLEETTVTYESDFYERKTVDVQGERERFAAPTTGEEWLETPQKLTKQGYFIDNYPDGVSGPEEFIEYYKVGTIDGKEIILGVRSELGYSLYFFEKSADGSVRHIVNPNKNWKYTEVALENRKKELLDTIVIDETNGYDSLSLPYSVPIGKDQLVYEPNFPSVGDPLFLNSVTSQGDETVNSLSGVKIVKRTYTYPETQLTNITYLVGTTLNTIDSYTYRPIQNDVKDVQWSVGVASVDDTVSAISRGCGLSGESVTAARTKSDSDFVAAGKTPDGKTWYHFSNSDDEFVTKAYDEFIEFYKDDPTKTGVTKDEFVAQHGIVAYKDVFGDWLLYTRDDLRPQAGCAKPVVYLYPEKETQVRVKVGADVTVSEPLYNPLSGWSATAFPDGSLNVDGKYYNSLFWEGYGYGEYPLTDKGVVIPTYDVERVVARQMTELGLTEQEKSDFLEFWSDKLPNSPYTRLTWFGTEDMNRLAPLHITPAPDTTIRVFLDMQGLDKPVFLLPQLLTSTERNGFTVVEWGGLADFQLK